MPIHNQRNSFVWSLSSHILKTSLKSHTQHLRTQFNHYCIMKFPKPESKVHSGWPLSDLYLSPGMTLYNCADSPSLTVNFTANGIPHAICLCICHCWAASLSVPLPVCDAGRLPREPDQTSPEAKVTSTPTGALASLYSASQGHQGRHDITALTLPMPHLPPLCVGVVCLLPPLCNEDTILHEVWINTVR